MTRPLFCLGLALLCACSRRHETTSGAVASTPAQAPATAGPPSTDIYLIRLSGARPASGVLNITNRVGYDNQPSWAGNARLLYTAQQPDGQTDIMRLDVVNSRTSRVTATAESEYSPAVTPDGEGISVVRVELDSTQRLWRFPLAGGPPEVLLPEVRPIGYFAWLDTTTVALFVLGEPNTLQIADTRTGRAVVAANRIGRSLQRVPGGRMASFLHRVGDAWVLKTLDPEPASDGSFRIDSVAVMPDSAEYVVWRSASEVYTVAGSRLFRMRLPAARWEVAADFHSAGLRAMSRLALSPDRSWLAVVADEPSQSP